jgi:hypothetical protein
MASGEETRVENPALPGIPEGVTLGMNIKDLLKMRPKAKPFDLGAALGEKPAPRPDELAKGSHLLMEKIEHEGFFSAGVYGLKDGRCVAFGMEGTHAREEFVQKRAEMVSRLVSLLGPNFERHLRRKYFKDASYLAPVFLWKGKERSVALTVTSEYPGVTFERGTLQLNVWSKGDEGLESAFEKDVDQVLLATLFTPLENEIRNAPSKKAPGP